ncbi:DNA (cytosine-5-)-methyltransferase [Microbulbifer sp. SA54]|uniref:DNA (cytosine-5-)-methyltransferase n=1 Tax=Microbulbifer sp. SA54 TaxID=3401577 RepID=UPI003AAC5F3B
MAHPQDIQQLLGSAVRIWGQKHVAEAMGVERETVNRWLKKKGIDELNGNFANYQKALKSLFPAKPRDYDKRKFDFIDLFAGIGGLRKAFEGIGGKCVFTSEWDEYAQRTYMANHYDDHVINGNIKDITEGHRLAEQRGVCATELSEREIAGFIAESIPDHHVLLAGFPCQPFSIAGVSKKNALGRAHGFDCKIQGTLFFDICKILKVKRPACFLLENVKNLKSHNKGDTYRTILEALDDAGYTVPVPQVMNAKDWLPQNRERIVIVGFRKDLGIGNGFDLGKVKPKAGEAVESLGELLDPASRIDPKYTLTEGLWNYLRAYKAKHRGNGNGFGYDLFTPQSTYTRTLSARYYKDGSEILLAKNPRHASKCEDGKDIPRRLTPAECARLMGFDRPGESEFRIPVSDTRAYKQFGNSVVVPMFESVAREMKKHIFQALRQESPTEKTASHRQGELFLAG